ncbi:calcium-binding protein, partial [Acinetobacter baumannii]
MRAERLRLSEEQGQRILRLYHLYRLTIGLVLVLLISSELEDQVLKLVHPELFHVGSWCYLVFNILVALFQSYDWTNLQYFNDVKFEGANFTDAQFLRVGNDLVIKAFGTEDSVTFKNYLSDSDSYSRDFNFLFADKTLTTADVMNIVIPLNG